MTFEMWASLYSVALLFFENYSVCYKFKLNLLNLTLNLAEAVNSLIERIDKLEESLVECENSLEVSKTVSSRLVKKCDDLEQYRRRLCLRILDVDGDDSKTSDDVFDKCKELFNNLELDIPEACINRAHRILKKTPGRVRPMIVIFMTWRNRTMVYRKRKDCVNRSITLDLTKIYMDILKEAIDLAGESDHISYALADINCSLCAKLSNCSFKFLNAIDDLNNLKVLYLFFVFALIFESVWFWKFWSFLSSFAICQTLLIIS